MKLLSFGFIVALLFVEQSLQAPIKCPSATEVGTECVCYPDLGSMICTNVQNPFNLTQNYDITTLVFKGIVQFPPVTDRIPPSVTLKIDSLVILHDNPAPLTLPSMLDLGQIFSISTTTLKIISKQEIPTALDMSELKSGLTSLTIEHVQTLNNFDLNNFPELTHLVLREVKVIKDLDRQLQSETKLRYLEITGNDKGFKELHTFKPTACAEGETIYIKLRHNKELNYFDFTQLFDSTKEAIKEKCSYRIDLSENLHLADDILIKQIAVPQNPANQAKVVKQTKKFKALTENGQFFLVMRNSPVKCDCSLRTAYIAYSAYLHSIVCNNKPVDPANKDKGFKFLADLTDQTCKNV